jgi:hypothetical protein
MQGKKEASMEFVKPWTTAHRNNSKIDTSKYSVRVQCKPKNIDKTLYFEPDKFATIAQQKEFLEIKALRGWSPDETNAFLQFVSECLALYYK